LKIIPETNISSYLSILNKPEPLKIKDITEEHFGELKTKSEKLTDHEYYLRINFQFKKIYFLCAKI